MSTWTIQAVLNWTKQYFGEKGIENPRLDAEVLLSHISGKDRIHLYVSFDQPLETYELKAYKELVLKRVQGIPVAYLVGHKEFMALDFLVNSSVLIPRPDTEILIEAALSRLNKDVSTEILDLGTGSGAVIVSLLHNLPNAQGIGIDISPQAVEVAAQNSVKHNLTDRLEILVGDLFSPVEGKVFDAIVSNPPYIVDSEIPKLSREVQCEPRQALAGGSDGLNFYRLITAKAPNYLKPAGFLAVEVGIHQAQAVALMATPKLRHESTLKDYAGIDRVVVFRRSWEV